MSIQPLVFLGVNGPPGGIRPPARAGA